MRYHISAVKYITLMNNAWTIDTMSRVYRNAFNHWDLGLMRRVSFFSNFFSSGPGKHLNALLVLFCPRIVRPNLFWRSIENLAKISSKPFRVPRP
jgi:hypothetical protein